MSYRRKNSALLFVLRALIPYSRENLMLSFRPHQFFNELEKNSRYNQQTLKYAFWQAKHQNLVRETKNQPRLTKQGLEIVKPYLAKVLKGAILMVIFDVPEYKSSERRQLRAFLKSLHFKQVQKSVWVTDKDFKEAIIEVISNLRLQGCVEIYESSRLFPKN